MLTIIYEIFLWLFLLYSIGIFSVYTWIALFAYGAVNRYKQGNTHTDYSIIASNPHAPSFSIIAPAYNEGKTIVENVRSLLSIYYHKLEIIIVNDGSKDDSIERLISAYQLEKVSYFISGNLPSQEVLQVYKSKNPAFRKLLVVDKKNGGKADALNVGINISKHDYIVCIDVDCIIEQDALLKLAKPFMEQREKRLVACGGVIRLANNCRVENGKVTAVHLPKTLLGRSQALEYIRAFVLGRMAWSRASGLILISGAFGAFDKEIVLACGGYDADTVGEDMELVVRIRRYMREQKLPHAVLNIPDPLCWTEAPEDKAILKKQRNRWMRGTMETLWKHRKLLFNPRYGKLGLVSLPYWFFFEFLGPLIEFLGYVFFWIFVLNGRLDWSFFLALYCLVIFSSVLYSIYAIFVDLMSQQVYSRRRDLGRLILAAVLEPFYFHPLVVFSGIRGMWDYFRKKNGWGDMVRQGFSQEIEETMIQKIKRKTRDLLQDFGSLGAIFLLILSINSLLEWYLYQGLSEQFKPFGIFLSVWINNLLFGSSFLLLFIVLYALLQGLGKPLSKWILKVLLAVILTTQLLLALYFSQSRNLLGTDLFFYSFEELKDILRASGMLHWSYQLAIVLVFSFLLALLHYGSQRWKSSPKLAYGLLSSSLIALLILNSTGELQSSGKDDFLHSGEHSKLGFFVQSHVDLGMENLEQGLFASEAPFDEGELTKEFPLLHTDQTRDILGSYLHPSPQTPNLVLIIIEGLGDAYSNSKGYIGDFTPFLSSLKDSSLVWENNLSSSGRTFSVLPTLLGSLPFGSSGFLEQASYPDHFNLINILKRNNFRTAFFYGGDAEFDFMGKYLRFSKIDSLYGIADYAEKYRRLPAGSGGSWGYEDQAVFSKMLEHTQQGSEPYFHIALTLSTHNPFLINDAEKYKSLFEARLNSLPLSAAQKQLAQENSKQLISVINMDDALRNFFEAYRKHPAFAHSIFIITGDHAMPEIPLQTKIDRFHVPLFIYSPLLKSSKRFSQTVSHFDLAPTLLAYYRQQYQLHIPNEVTWLGRGLDIGTGKLGNGAAMMQSKSQLIDFVYDQTHLHEQKVYLLDANLQDEEIPKSKADERAKVRFERFRSLNKAYIAHPKLLPDSVFQAFFKP